MLALGCVILAAGHLLMYLVLTTDARGALTNLEATYGVSALEGTKDPGAAPQPGGEAYSQWLGAYERWWASKDVALHGRHEGLVRTGMILSFLIGLGLLAQGLRRTSQRTPVRRRGPTSRRDRTARPARRPAPTRPLRPIVYPVAVRPVLVRQRRSA